MQHACSSPCLSALFSMQLIVDQGTKLAEGIKDTGLHLAGEVVDTGTELAGGFENCWRAPFGGRS